MIWFQTAKRLVISVRHSNSMHSYGAVFAEAAVDDLRGTVRIRRIYTVHDAGAHHQSETRSQPGTPAHCIYQADDGDQYRVILAADDSRLPGTPTTDST